MDFLRNHAHLAGGDTRKAPNLANHGIRQEGKGPPHATPSIPLNHGISRHSLSILSNTNTLCLYLKTGPRGPPRQS